MSVQALRRGSLWSAMGWLFVLALAVRPVAGGHSHAHHAHPAESHSQGAHLPAGSPADTPTPEPRSPDSTQPCPCASSCSASAADAPDPSAPVIGVALSACTLSQAHPPARPSVKSVRFRLPLANAPPPPGVLFMSI